MPLFTEHRKSDHRKWDSRVVVVARGGDALLTPARTAGTGTAGTGTATVSELGQPQPSWQELQELGRNWNGHRHRIRMGLTLRKQRIDIAGSDIQFQKG